MSVNRKTGAWKALSLYTMSGVYVLAGSLHFARPASYGKIMPPWLPYPHLLVILSGIAEVVLGLALLHPWLRRPAAWGLILLLIAVFPANIQMMLDFRRNGDPYFWLTVARLPLQVLFIAWAYVFTKRPLYLAA